MKNRKNILKEAGVIIIVIAMISLSYTVAAGGVIFHQGYYTSGTPWVHTSDSHLPWSYLCKDDFWGLTSQITGVRWWGETCNYTGAWSVGNPAGMRFNIIFYQDSSGSPGSIVASFNNIAPTWHDTGIPYMYSFELYEFETSLSSPVSLTNGWISIQGIYSPTDAWFLWSGSPDNTKNALQSGVPFTPADSLAFNLTTTGVPIALDVSVDIKPATWPNSLNTHNKGLLPVAICGSNTFDVTTIDPATIKINREGVATGVSPIRWSYADVATPYPSDTGGGWALGADGYLDLCLKFDTPAVATTLGLSSFVGQTIPLIITGNLKPAYGSTAITGYDYVQIIK